MYVSMSLTLWQNSYLMVVAFSLHLRIMGESLMTWWQWLFPCIWRLWGKVWHITLCLHFKKMCRSAHVPTVAQWAEITVDELSLMSCVWAHFPGRFPHYAWTEFLLTGVSISSASMDALSDHPSMLLLSRLAIAISSSLSICWPRSSVSPSQSCIFIR